MSVWNVETASTSSASELKTTVARIRHEAAGEQAQRESEEKMNQRIVQILQNKRRLAEETVVELRTNPQTKSMQMNKLT